MVVAILPSDTSFHPFKTNLAPTNSSFSNRCSTEALYPVSSVDTFHLQRNTLLKVLESPSLFEAVLDESKKPTLQVKALRQMLSKQKITTQELFASPALLSNFYAHLALQAEKNLTQTTDPKKQEELKLQSTMMRSLAAEVQKLPLSCYQSDLQSKPENRQLQKGPPKFGALISLFAKTMMLFTEKGNWQDKEPEDRQKDCEKIINIGSVLAGATAGALTKFMFADDAALTAVTVGTITRMAYGVYGIENVSPASLGVIIGKACGARIADGLLNYAIEKGLSIIPFLGEIATATTAFTLHQATGRLFMHYFENQIAQGKEPGLPVVARGLLAGFGLAQATHLIDSLDASQSDHYNTLNDIRVEQGDFEAAPHTCIDTVSNKVIEIHNIWDEDGTLIGIPGSEDFLNHLLITASSADDIVSLGKTLSKAPHDLTKKVIAEVRKNGKLSSETMVELLGYGNALSAGALLVLGGPNQILNPGYIDKLKDLSQADSFEQLVNEHFNVANGLDIDPAVITAWATQGVVSVSSSEKAQNLKNQILAMSKTNTSSLERAKLRKKVAVDDIAKSQQHANQKLVEKLEQSREDKTFEKEDRRDWHELHSQHRFQQPDVEYTYKYYDSYQGRSLSMIPIKVTHPNTPKDAIERLSWGYGFCDLHYFRHLNPDKEIKGAALLHTAILFNEEAVVESLIKRGADVNRYSYSGNTPLTIVTRTGNLNLTKKLVNAGANINKPNGKGHTPLYYAIKYRSKDIVAYLQKRNAKLS